MITIEVMGQGVTAVNIPARSDSEEKEALILYNRISHLVREIDALICGGGNVKVRDVALASSTDELKH